MRLSHNGYLELILRAQRHASHRGGRLRSRLFPNMGIRIRSTKLTFELIPTTAAAAGKPSGSLNWLMGELSFSRTRDSVFLGLHSATQKSLYGVKHDGSLLWFVDCFSDCSKPFSVRLCLTRAVRSLSVEPQLRSRAGSPVAQSPPAAPHFCGVL